MNKGDKLNMHKVVVGPMNTFHEFELIEVEYLCTLHRYILVIHEDEIHGEQGNYSYWIVSELTSGCRVCYDLDKNTVVKKALLLISEQKEDGFQSAINRAFSIIAHGS